MFLNFTIVNMTIRRILSFCPLVNVNAQVKLRLASFANVLIGKPQASLWTNITQSSLLMTRFQLILPVTMLQKI